MSALSLRQYRLRMEFWKENPMRSRTTSAFYVWQIRPSLTRAGETALRIRCPRDTWADIKVCCSTEETTQDYPAKCKSMSDCGLMKTAGRNCRSSTHARSLSERFLRFRIQRRSQRISILMLKTIYDECRYVCMDHPVAATKKPPREYKPWSPFDEN